MSQSFIKMQNISYNYSEKEIFKDFNFDIELGTKTAVMAPSGTGKTTLLYLIAGLYTPQSGTIEYLTSNPRFSFVFQENRLLEKRNILDNLRLTNPQLTSETIKGMLYQAGLSVSVTKPIHRLSGGEKRRIAIIRALLSPYDILLMDEPFTGLDDENRLRIIELIKEYTEGKTVILVTHDKTDAQLLNCNIINL